MVIVIGYYCSFLLVGYILYSLIRSVKQRVTIESIVCFLLLFSFFGFRDLSILNDTAHYYDHFRHLIKYDSFFKHPFYYINPHERFEPAFQIFERILGYLTSEPYSIIMISALVISFMSIWFINKFTHHVALYTFFLLTSLCLTAMYSSIRQSLAMCIFFIAFTYLLNKKWLGYYLLIIAAMFFHSSAFILLFLPILDKIELNKKNVILTFCVSFVVFIFLDTLLEVIGTTDSVYYQIQMKRETIPLAVILDLLTIVLFLILCVHIRRQYNIDKNDCKLLWWTSILNLSVIMCSLRFIVLVRFAKYFFPITIILLLSHIFTVEGRERNKYLYCMIFFILLRFVSILLLKNEWYHLYPYRLFDFNELYHNTNTGY